MTVCHNVTSEPHRQTRARTYFSLKYFFLCDYGGSCVCLKIQSNRKPKKRGDKKKPEVCEFRKGPDAFDVWKARHREWNLTLIERKFLLIGVESQLRSAPTKTYHSPSVEPLIILDHISHVATYRCHIKISSKSISGLGEIGSKAMELEECRTAMWWRNGSLMIYDVSKYSTRFIVAGKPSICHRPDCSRDLL